MSDVTFAVSADIKGFQARMGELQREVQKAAGAAESRFARMSQFLGSGRQLVTGLLGVGTAMQGISRVAGQIAERASELEDKFYGQSEGVKDLGRLWNLYKDNAAGGLMVVKEAVGSVTGALIGQNSELRRTLDMYAAKERFTARVDAVEKARPARQLFERITQEESDNALGDGLAGRLMKIRRAGEQGVGGIDAVMASLRAAKVPGELIQTLGGDEARRSLAGQTADEALAAMNEAFAKDDEAAARDFEARSKATEQARKEVEARDRARAMAEEDFSLSLQADEVQRLRAAGMDQQARSLEDQVRLRQQLLEIARDEALTDEQKGRFSRGLSRAAAALAAARGSGDAAGSGRGEGGFSRDVVSGLSAAAGTLGVFAAGPVENTAQQQTLAAQQQMLKAVEVVSGILNRIASAGLPMVPKMV